MRCSTHQGGAKYRIQVSAVQLNPSKWRELHCKHAAGCKLPDAASCTLVSVSLVQPWKLTCRGRGKCMRPCACHPLLYDGR